MSHQQERPQKPILERAIIEPLVLRKRKRLVVRRRRRRTRWCFVLRDERGRDLLRSVDFTSASSHPTNNPREREALQNLLWFVGDEGWTIARRPDVRARNRWWEFHVVRGDQAAGQRDMQLPEALRDLQMANDLRSGDRRAPELPRVARRAWSMRVITLVVIIGIVLIGAALVLILEIRFFPAG